MQFEWGNLQLKSFCFLKITIIMITRFIISSPIYTFLHVANWLDQLNSIPSLAGRKYNYLQWSIKLFMYKALKFIKFPGLVGKENATQFRISIYSQFISGGNAHLTLWTCHRFHKFRSVKNELFTLNNFH